MPKERPIIFSPPMVRAIIEGRKTETRRPIKPSHLRRMGPGEGEIEIAKLRETGLTPYGRAGNRLRVKEAWAEVDGRIIYRADNDLADVKWKSPLFMPAWASRITLKITSTTVEHLQDITENAARREGFSSRDEFKEGWDRLYRGRKALRWESNPLVWVIRFKVLSISS